MRPAAPRRRLAFIDDDAAFEIPLFLEVFGQDFDVIAAATFEDFAARVGARGDWRRTRRKRKTLTPASRIQPLTLVSQIARRRDFHGHEAVAGATGKWGGGDSMGGGVDEMSAAPASG